MNPNRVANGIISLFTVVSKVRQTPMSTFFETFIFFIGFDRYDMHPVAVSYGLAGFSDVGVSAPYGGFHLPPPDPATTGAKYIVARK